MCGIYFSLSRSFPVLPSKETLAALESRGPDSTRSHHVHLQKEPHAPTSSSSRDNSVHLTFVSTVLALRGDFVQTQPLIDAESTSVLCWNGEAWKINGELIQGNDTQVIFKEFLSASQPSPTSTTYNGSYNNDQSLQRLCRLISSISGPFSFVFYDANHARLYFTRDCLGRRSLLQTFDDNGNFILSSISNGVPLASFVEVETTGLHMIDLSSLWKQQAIQDYDQAAINIETIAWQLEPHGDLCYLKKRIPTMNRDLPKEIPQPLTLDSPSVQALQKTLHEALALRITNVPQPSRAVSKHDAKIGVLFSGGLDCTVLARLAHNILPLHESIDLLNVAFENPRVVAASAKNGLNMLSPTSIYESCPDRITGRAGHAELQKVCPGRHWRFVAVNVPYTETLAHRDRVKQLMRPHNTEMDLSIACALYFASRGQGTTIPTGEEAGAKTPMEVGYTTTARVLLSGLGADELFAGYSRHVAGFERSGFQGLIDEIDLDVGRLGKRNLGRDDRVISHWGREARYPYLDEDFLSWATRTPVWERCGFGTAATNGEAAAGATTAVEASSIEPGKKALRLVALNLGMSQVAREKKRAIQFGSRTAKMESGRTRGTTQLD